MEICNEWRWSVLEVGAARLVDFKGPTSGTAICWYLVKIMSTPALPFLDTCLVKIRILGNFREPLVRVTKWLPRVQVWCSMLRIVPVGSLKAVTTAGGIGCFYD